MRASRAAFVVMYTVWDGSNRDRSLHAHFIRHQKVGEEITIALASHKRAGGCDLLGGTREVRRQHAAPRKEPGGHGLAHLDAVARFCQEELPLFPL